MCSPVAHPRFAIRIAVACALVAGFAAIDAEARTITPFARVEALDGTGASPAIRAAEFREALFAVTRELGHDRADRLRADLDAARRAGATIPIGLIDVEVRGPRAREGQDRVFALAPLRGSTHRGGRARFALAPDFVLRDRDPSPIVVDFGDGTGPRTIVPGEPFEVRYAQAGTKVWQVISPARARATFEVAALGAPAPDDTLTLSATTSFEGAAASGEAYVYLAPGHTTLTRPVIVIEGFDLDNSLDWDGLYALLNQENLLEDLRGLGHDAVVVNFSDATDAIQRNAYLVADVIDTVRVRAGGSPDLVVIGASMGGLVGRHALAWMESIARPHGVRAFISFDAPQRGANIPLGIQYWVRFFADQSTEAGFLRDVLDSPAARQMLVYHATEPPTSTANPAAARDSLVNALTALGGYPSSPRNVAIANGSGAGVGQTFTAGEQIVRWVYDTILIDVIGNVWAVPDGGALRIFQGLMRVPFVINASQNVTVSGTLPYDDAPGGSRETMAQMAAVSAPFGTIEALHDRHCFIPTVSALDLDVANLFHDVLGDPQILAHTPFDAIYVPALNEPHVSITPESAQWFIGEIEGTVLAVAPPPVPNALSIGASPNPFAARVRLTLEAAPGPRVAPLRIDVFDIDGRLVARLDSGVLPAGRRTVEWDGRDRAGNPVAPGVYLVRAERGADRAERRIVRLR